MADTIPATPEDSAEKAYAAAADAVVTIAEPAKVEAIVEAAPAPKPVVKVAPAPAAKVAPAPKAAPAPVAKLRKPAKPVAVKVKPATVKAVTAAKPAKIIKPKAAAKPAVKISKPTDILTIPKLKDTIMTKTKTTTTDFTATIKGVAADVQGKAKAAFAKGSAALGEANEFTKGNVEAVVASGKILAAGLQNLGTGYVAESKTAFETLTADVKALTAVKSPTDFFKLQGELLRRNFDAAVAATSKNSEAAIKLANETIAPISGRVSLVIEKVKKAA